MLYSDDFTLIKKLLTLDNNNEDIESQYLFSDLNKHLVAKTISDLLIPQMPSLINCNSQPEVEKFLADTQKNINKEKRISLHELEAHLLFEIQDGRVQTVPRILKKTPETDLEKKLFPIAYKLNAWLEENTNAPTVVITKKTLETTLVENKALINLLDKDLVVQKDYEINRHNFRQVLDNTIGLILGYLWKHLSDVKSGLKNFLKLIATLDAEIWQIEFVDLESKEQFTQSIILYLQSLQYPSLSNWNGEVTKQILKRYGIGNNTFSLDTLTARDHIEFKSFSSAFMWLSQMHFEQSYDDTKMHLISYLLRENVSSETFKNLFEFAKNSSSLMMAIFNGSSFYKTKLLNVLLSHEEYIDLAFYILSTHTYTSISWKQREQISDIENIGWKSAINHLISTCSIKENTPYIFYNSLFAVSQAAISFSGMKNDGAYRKLKVLINSLKNEDIIQIEKLLIERSPQSCSKLYYANLNLLFLIIDIHKTEELQNHITSTYIARVKKQISSFSSEINQARTDLSNDNLYFTAIELMNSFNWEILGDSITNLIDETLFREIKHAYNKASKDARRKLGDIIRTHMAVLLNAVKNENHKQLIVEELFDYVREYAFDDTNETFDGLFRFIIDGGSSNKEYGVNLNLRFASILNSLDEATFKQFIKLIKRKQVSTYQLLLYTSYITKETRLEELTKIIKARKSNAVIDGTTVDEIKQSVNLAHSLNLFEIRDILIKDGTKNSHKSFSNDWQSINYQYSLINVFNEEASKEEKFEKISKLENNLQNILPSNYIEGNKRYGLYIRAIIHLESEPDKSCHILENICRRDKQSLYTTALFEARVISHEQQLEGSISIRSAINEWLSLSGKEFNNFSNFTDSELAILLKAYLVDNNKSEFDIVWQSLSEKQRYSFDFSEFYIKQCLKTDNHKSAKDHLRRFEEYHQSGKSDSKGLQNKVSKLREYISSPIYVGDTSEVKIELTQLATPEDVIANLAAKWREIQSLNHEELARVISPVTVTKQHLLELIHQTNLVVFQDLISQRLYFKERKSTKDANEAKSDGLVDEDHISAMYLKTIKNKFSLFGWHVSDQSKIGNSPTGKGLGEVDGWLRSNTGESIAVFEALILNSLKKNELNEHLNKISGYDTAASPIVIFAVYYSGKSFETFKTKYVSHIKSYNTPNYQKPSQHEIKVLEESDRLYCFREKRKRGGKEVHFTHYVMSLLY